MRNAQSLLDRAITARQLVRISTTEFTDVRMRLMKLKLDKIPRLTAAARVFQTPDAAHAGR